MSPSACVERRRLGPIVLGGTTRSGGSIALGGVTSTLQPTAQNRHSEANGRLSLVMLCGQLPQLHLCIGFVESGLRASVAEHWYTKSPLLCAPFCTESSSGKTSRSSQWMWSGLAPVHQGWEFCSRSSCMGASCCKWVRSKFGTKLRSEHPWSTMLLLLGTVPMSLVCILFRAAIKMWRQRVSPGWAH